MTTITLTKDQYNTCLQLAKNRHNSKNEKIRNKNTLMKDPKKDYYPHLIGILGEMAWAIHTGQDIDSNIYKTTTKHHQDFVDTEVKTTTYFGDGEPELKIPKKEFKRKQAKLYILARVDIKKLTEIQILGTITHNKFVRRRKTKRYGKKYPFNWVVPLSKMEEVVEIKDNT
jgi:hypothetical protein